MCTLTYEYMSYNVVFWVLAMGSTLDKEGLDKELQGLESPEAGHESVDGAPWACTWSTRTMTSSRLTKNLDVDALKFIFNNG